MKKIFFALLLIAIVVIAVSCGDKKPEYEYTESADGVTITKYNGSLESVRVPDTINGKAVICIGTEAFAENTSIETLILPQSVQAIAPGPEMRFETKLAMINNATLMTELNKPAAVPKPYCPPTRPNV